MQNLNQISRFQIGMAQQTENAIQDRLFRLPGCGGAFIEPGTPLGITQNQVGKSTANIDANACAAPQFHECSNIFRIPA